MTRTSSARVSKRRASLRTAGFRPIQIWVPDTRAIGFAAECKRQAALVAAHDRADAQLGEFLDAALDDLARGSA